MVRDQQRVFRPDPSRLASGRQNSLGGRQSIRRGTQVGGELADTSRASCTSLSLGPSRGGLDVRKIAQDALLKVSTCVSTITYDDDIDDDQRNGSADGGCTVRSPAALLNTKIGSVNYYDSSTLPPTTESDNDSDSSFDQHRWQRVTPPAEFGGTLRQPCNVGLYLRMMPSRIIRRFASTTTDWLLPLLSIWLGPGCFICRSIQSNPRTRDACRYSPDIRYVGALMYDHKAFIENVLELDTEGTTPKLVGGIQGDSDSSRSDFKVREKLLEFSYTHYNPLLHNVMLLSLPSRRHGRHIQG